MYKITPLHPLARDTATGKVLPKAGIERDYLTTADHLQQRTGDTDIQTVDKSDKKAKQ